jgi:transposase
MIGGSLMASFLVLRSGAPWRDLPERYGPRITCYNRFLVCARADRTGDACILDTPRQSRRPIGAMIMW